MKNYEPYKKGYLSVGDGHELYYEFCGNPKAKSVLFLHGGPGVGFSEHDKDFFDPEDWNILLFDQRGAGRSKPFASIEHNTTQKLVEDIDKLLDFAGIEKTFLFGGSWGSTLALVYAITNPAKVTGMLLRGIWLAGEEDKQYYLGGGVSKHFPDAWERFISHIPASEQHDFYNYYAEQMQSNDEAIVEKYTYEWAYFELSILRLKTTPEQIAEDMKDFSYRSLAPLEVYYISNNCFIPENFILNNADKIKHIPMSIVHGRYDVICPPINAYKLHKKIKNSKLIYTTAGHTSGEPETKKALIEEMKLFAKNLHY